MAKLGTTIVYPSCCIEIALEDPRRNGRVRTVRIFGDHVNISNTVFADSFEEWEKTFFSFEIF